MKSHLVECPACQKPVSAAAWKCPGCTQPLRSVVMYLVKGLFGLLAILGLLWFLWEGTAQWRSDRAELQKAAQPWSK